MARAPWVESRSLFPYCRWLLVLVFLSSCCWGIAFFLRYLSLLRSTAIWMMSLRRLHRGRTPTTAMPCCSGAFHRRVYDARMKTGRGKGTRHRLELGKHTESTTSVPHHWPHEVGEGQVRPTSGAANIAEALQAEDIRDNAHPPRSQVNTDSVSPTVERSLDWPQALALHFFFKKKRLSRTAQSPCLHPPLPPPAPPPSSITSVATVHEQGQHSKQRHGTQMCVSIELRRGDAPRQ